MEEANIQKSSIWSAQGRIGRLTYFKQTLFFLLFVLLAIFIMELDNFIYHIALDKYNTFHAISKVFVGASFSSYIYFSVLATIKRLHDSNLSGWWSVLIFCLTPFVIIYMILIITVMVIPTTNTDNKYSEVSQITQAEIISSWLCKMLLVLQVITFAIIIILSIYLYLHATHTDWDNFHTFYHSVFF